MSKNHDGHDATIKAPALGVNLPISPAVLSYLSQLGSHVFFWTQFAARTEMERGICNHASSFGLFSIAVRHVEKKSA